MAKLRFGVVGLTRGENYIKEVARAGGEVVACCDINIPLAKKVIKNVPEVRDDVYLFENFDEFLNCDMDVVILANYFCEHAKYAIKALDAGFHVLSETLSNVTMAEGVALCRAAERSGKFYGLLENYPYTKARLHMRDMYKSGELGSIVYAEGEYTHPLDADTQNYLTSGELHWRNWTPRTYYSTHALAPLMMMTDSMPKKVCTMTSFKPELAKGTALRTGDAAAIMMISTDTDAVFRVTGWAVFSPEISRYRLSCTKGTIEDFREKVRCSLKNDYNDYSVEWTDPECKKFEDVSGHSGSDFCLVYEIIKDLEKGISPYFDVYRSTAMASVAILGWRSVLEGGIPFDIPDFRLEEDKKKYENDTISPFPNENGVAAIPCSSKPYTPTEEDLKQAHYYWDNEREARLKRLQKIKNYKFD